MCSSQVRAIRRRKAPGRPWTRATVPGRGGWTHWKEQLTTRVSAPPLHQPTLPLDLPSLRYNSSSTIVISSQQGEEHHPQQNHNSLISTLSRSHSNDDNSPDGDPWGGPQHCPLVPGNYAKVKLDYDNNENPNQWTIIFHKNFLSA